jgi:hypothetical protein
MPFVLALGLIILFSVPLTVLFVIPEHGTDPGEDLESP